MRSTYFGIGVHKFPKVPRQYFVTPVFDNQKLYDTPSELQCYYKPIMQPPIERGVDNLHGVVIEHFFLKFSA